MEAEDNAYLLVAEESLGRPTDVEEWTRLQNTVIGILRQYADKLYRRRRERWESSHMVYKKLDETDANFSFNKIREDGWGRYVVGVPRSDQELIEEIEGLIADCSALYESETDSLPRIYFDRHLYQPLLVENGGRQLNMSPPGLNPSEQRFVKDLMAYWTGKGEDCPSDAEVFLLRNQGKGTGVGFFEDSDFYPDFILWIKTGDAQRIVFVEPHGMIHAPSYRHDDKAQLHEKLPELARTVSQRSDGTKNVSLDSFIVSATPFEELRRRYDDGSWNLNRFASRHILFPKRDGEYDYVAEIVKV